jgi:glutaredoxin 1
MKFVIYTIPNCTFCVRAKALAEQMGFDIEERDFYALDMWEWLAKIGEAPETAPQIFVEGVYIGGCNAFEDWAEQ